MCIQKLYIVPVSPRHAHSLFSSCQISIHFQPFSVGGDRWISPAGSGLASESQCHEGWRVEPIHLWLPAGPHKFLSVTATRKQTSFLHSGNFCDNGNPCSTVILFSFVIPSRVASNLAGKKPILNAQRPFLLLTLRLQHIPFVKSPCPSLSSQVRRPQVYPWKWAKPSNKETPATDKAPRSPQLNVDTCYCANTPDSA